MHWQRDEELSLLRPQKRSSRAFTFVAPERVKEGIYTVSAETTDERGAHSEYAKLI